MAGNPRPTRSATKAIGGWAFMFGAAGCYGIAGLYYPAVAADALSSLAALLIRVVPVLGAVFVFLFLADLFIDRNWLARNLGGASGIRGWVIAVASGILSAGPLYAWYPLLRELRDKGMSNALIAAFLYSRALKLPLLPLMVHYSGPAYTVRLSICIIAFSVLNGLFMRYLSR